MFIQPLTVLHGMLLLASPMTPDAQLPLPHCETGTRHVELGADAPGPVPEVCIRPGLSLSLFFDVKLARVEIEGRERFRRVDEADSFLSILPSEDLRDGDRIPVTVYFLGVSTPMRASFTLVVHPTQAERQVEVSRHERSVASYRQGEQQARAEARQCQEEKTRLQAGCGSPGGLTDLIGKGWLGPQGVIARQLTGIVSRSGLPLSARGTFSYRAVGPDGQGRVAVEVMIRNAGTATWTPAGAALVAQHGMLTELKVAPLEAIAPGKQVRIIVEADAAEDEARGTLSLKLWDDQGREGTRLEGVTFP